MNTHHTLQTIRTAVSSVRGLFTSSTLRELLAPWTAFDPCRMPAPVPVPVPVPGRRTGRAALFATAMLTGTFALLAGTAPAEASYAQYVADGDIVDVQVKVRGRTAPLYMKPDDWNRMYFQAFKNRNYSLVLRNNTNRRIGVLIAVDGLNVVNGEQSRLRSTEPMYVLDPYGSAEIKGWRTSLSSVRRFVFVDEHRSYAERTGQANGDMGWIRVLAFEENRPHVRDWNPRLPWLNKNRPGEELGDGRSDDDGARSRGKAEQPRRQAAPNTSREPSEGMKPQAESFHGQPDNFPGTGWGDRKHDPVRRTQFVANHRATDQIALRYEYAAGLRALGIFPHRHRDRLWDRDNGQLGFAKPPRW